MFRLIRLILICGAMVLLALAAFAQTNGAQLMSDNIPVDMVPGFSYDVTVTMKNTGTTTWTSAGGYRLGAVGDSDPFAPGRINLASGDSIAPGQQKTFSFTMIVPSVGTYITDWRMVQENVAWFGDTLTKQVVVGFGSTVPGTPTITWPTCGMILGSNRPDITIQGEPCNAYEVHIGSQNNPDSNDGWDSGVVEFNSGPNPIMAMSGVLNAQAHYYVFARLHNTNGWGPWSEYGNYFYTTGQLVNDPYIIAGQDGAQWMHTMCYNPDRNEYLVCYFDARTWRKSVIAYYRLDSAGNKIGEEAYVSDDLEGVGGPNVCYNSARKEYLIAYGGYTSNQGIHNELRVQRVNAITGALIGGSNWIRNSPVVIVTKVAYSPTSNCYLLVWEDNIDSPAPVYGLRLDSTAVPMGDIFHISNGTYTYAGNPQICYNSTNHEFFVTFHAYREWVNPSTWWDSYAQRVRASDGALMGSNIIISESLLYDWNSGVAYDSDMNRYLTIYEGGELSPYGQFISASGTLIGSRFPIADAYYKGGMASIAWSPITKEYLATWAHGNSYGNYARRLSQTGAYIAEPFRTNGDVEDIGNWNPIPVVNTSNGEFLINWFCSYDNVFVRRYKSYPLAPVGTVTGFTVAGDGGQNIIKWTNPTYPGFTGIMIRYSTSGYPSTINDGTLVVNKAGEPGLADSFVHTGLVNGTTYYYSIFTHNVFYEYSDKAAVYATPLWVINILNSTFGSPSSGWTLSGWGVDPNPAHWGTIVWEGGVGNPTGGLRFSGYGTTDNDSRTLRAGGSIKKLVSTIGYKDIKLSYDLRVGSLGSIWSGIGADSGDVKHNDVQDQLIIYYSETGINGPWTEIDWLGKNTLLNYTNYGKRLIDLSGIPGVSDNANLALQFLWQFNTASANGDIGDLDNIKVTGSILGKNGTCGSVRSLDNTTPVSFADKVLYYRQSNYGYIEDINRISGIRVESSALSSLDADQAISLKGTMQTNPTTGEKYIQVSTLQRGAQTNLRPLAMNQRDLKRDLADGLLVRMWGLVKSNSITSNSFVISDGSDNEGIKIITTDAPGVTENTFVTVTGAAGKENSKRVIYRK